MLVKLDANDTLALCTKTKQDNHSNANIAGKGVIITHGMKDIELSSLEI